MVHYLKIWPIHYQRVKNGSKTFEIRENDRCFQRGDLVKLCEWNQETEKYTGSRDLVYEIGDVYAIDETRVVFSLLSMTEEKWKEVGQEI